MGAVIRDGFAVVDKPSGWTSHDVVARCRRFFQTRKVGHAGTLDPMATGVLVLGIGKGTRLLSHVVGVGKTYEATIRLGHATDTDDSDGNITSTHDASAVSDADVAQALAQLSGTFAQVPSTVSAIKVDGKRAYARVKSGEDVTLKPRTVTVEWTAVGSLREVSAAPELRECDVVVEVSSGTYVRALARDLGEILGVGGHLTSLRRTRVGKFSLEQASLVSDIEALHDAGVFPPLMTLGRAASHVMSTLRVGAQEARALTYGQRPAAPQETPADVPVAIIGPDDSLVAVAQVDSGTLRPVSVFQDPGP